MNNSQEGETLSTHFSDARNAAGQSLEKISHDYYVMAKMQGSDDASMGGVRINQSGRIESSAKPDKDKEYTRHMQMLLLLHDLEQMELQLEDKYGENFAEQLAAEHLDEETYNRIMDIQDQDERRQAIALALKEGIENGTIDPAVFDDPQIREWIDARAEAEELTVKQAELESTQKPDTLVESGIDNSYINKTGTNDLAALDKLF